MHKSRVTYCPPAKAAGHCLDDVIAFLRAGLPLPTARILAEAWAIALRGGEMPDELWDKFMKYLDKIVWDGVYDFQMDFKEFPVQYEL